MQAATHTTLLVSGDSMSEHGTWPRLVARATGWRVDSNARSGQTSTEIALRDGAIDMTVSVDGAGSEPAVVSVTPLHPTSSFRGLIDEPMQDIVAAGTLGGIRGELRHRVTEAPLDAWTFAAHVTQETTRLAPGIPYTFAPDPRPLPQGGVAAIWCGRNNPGSDALRDIDALTRRLTEADPSARFLVLGIVNSELEPRGTAAHAEIDALNGYLQRSYGERFVELRSLLIAEGDETDIPHASFRLDIIHLNEAGDRVVADAVLDRLRALDWWDGEPDGGSDGGSHDEPRDPVR